ncbi:MAG: glycosyltransferase family 4 protein [Candidatus Dormibacteria bacterium]
MRVVFDARMYHHLGIGTMVRNLLSEMVVDARGHTLVLLRGGDLPAGLERAFTSVPVGGGPFSPVAHLNARLAIRRLSPDVVVFPFYVTTGGARTVAVVADCIPDHDRTALAGPARNLYYRRYMRRAVRVSRPLLAISEHTRRDLARFHGRSHDVRVMPLAADPRLRPSPPSEVERFRAKHGLERPFILYLGQWRGYKNLEVVMAALSQLGAAAPDLVIGGGADPARVGGDAALDRRGAQLTRQADALGIGSRLRVLGFVPDEDLAAAYGAARAYVFPSRLEGFGLPALEAMACGTPVIAARAGALPEVVGDSQILLDPDGVGDWVAAIERLVNDDHEHERLSAAGLSRAREFSWRRSADILLDAVES